MYKVAVITMGIRLDDEKGYTRFRSVCEFLADAGYQVDLITTVVTPERLQARVLTKLLILLISLKRKKLHTKTLKMSLTTWKVHYQKEN